MRIALDVSPLSHPRDRASATTSSARSQGLLEAAGRRARGRRVRADEPTRAEAGSATRSPACRSRRGRWCCRSRTRSGWAGAARGGRSPSAGWARFDVLHFTDWQVPAAASGRPLDDDPRPRPAPLPGVGDAANALDARRQVRTHRRECDLVFVNSAFTGRDVEELLGIPAERIRVAPPGVGDGYGPGRRATPRSAARTCSASRRSSRARTSARSSRRGGRSATSSRSRSPARPAGATRPLLDDPAIVKLGFVPYEEAPRSCAAPRSSPTRRGSRASASRSSRRWRAASPVVASVAPVPRRGVRRRGGAGRPGRPRGDDARRSARRSSGGTSSRRAGLAHAAGFTWRAHRRDPSPRASRRPSREGRPRRRARSCRRAPAPRAG